VLLELQVTIDCADPVALADFWSAALGYVHHGSQGPYVSIVDRERRHPQLVFQRVDEPKVGKDRIHLDVYVDDVTAEVARLSQLGAQVAEGGWFEEEGEHWQVMADPEGNEFCVCSR
jgi:predicted enzyme related to lactoylglutathione lyase